MQDFLDASDRFTQAQVVSRALITAYTGEFPGVRDEVILQLSNNAQHVLDEYGAFFSNEKRVSLELLIADALAEGGDDDPVQVIENLNAIVDEMQAEFNVAWDANQPLGLLASELKFIFGGCNPPASHPLLAYFGDLQVATRIVQEGNDAQFCDP